MVMDTNYNVGKRIRDLRLAKGLSQEQLALSADITPTYLGLVERNLKNPTLKVIEQICNSLNVSLSDFFSDSYFEDKSLDSTTQQILSQLVNRTQEEKELILQLTKDMLKLRDLPCNQEKKK